jgi:malate dehydrogenase (oxaloacetate-decarboxylating)
MLTTPSASYSQTVRLELRHRPGLLGKVTTAISRAGADIGAIDLVNLGADVRVRDVTFNARDDHHAEAIVNRLQGIPGVRVVNASDRTFLMHLGGKIEVRGRVPVKTRDDLSMAYTPGVARVCLAIRDDPEKAFSLTIKQNSVAVVTDGTAVLGLGDIGPRAAMPVMEGKALLFKSFANVDAYPICLDTKDPDEIVLIVRALAPGFGGINLEDISAPRCFEIEARLRKELDIPVFHDDQHGTAVVVLASLLNALRVVKKRLENVRVVFAGAGASAIATARLLMAVGCRRIVACDQAGLIYRGRSENMNPAKAWLAEHTNRRRRRGSLGDALENADVFIGLSGPGVAGRREIGRMARDPIVFAMANPVPEVRPEEVRRLVRVMATGRSDYPNQINNVLCFPGFFRGLLDVRSREVNEAMKIAAAHAIASIVRADELAEDYIVPSVFDRRVVAAVAQAVAGAAARTGAARRHSRPARPLPGNAPA